jgi:hypothetical protein
MKRNVPALLALIWLTATRCWAVEPNDAPSAVEPALKDNEEAARLFSEDQSDRLSKDGKPLDWKVIKKVVVPRDRARRKRVLELYAAGELRTTKDFVHAGIVLQHGEKPEHYLLSHELCITAVFKSCGSEEDSWVSLANQLAALSEDWFLLSVGRPQRFGTQFRKGRLVKIDQGVTDEVRKIWNFPPLAITSKVPH